MDSLLSSYQFDLPDSLIASRPQVPRDESRLLVYDEKLDKIFHQKFSDLHKFLPADSTLVLNQSKVFACRLIGNKRTGAKAEIFVLDIAEKNCLIKSSSKKNLGDVFILPNFVEATIVQIFDNGTFQLDFSIDDLEGYLEKFGMIPIPPYIRNGQSDEQDKVDYQTIYSKTVGSVAAPTAGLHFTTNVFDSLEKKGIQICPVTLHVGMGTFAPVKSENIHEHKMHFENYSIGQEQLDILKSKRPVYCVGTTSLRVLESVWDNLGDTISNHVYKTNIFLHPGKDVNSIDGMITNFHLPGSSLIMLVSAILGRSKTLELYQIAIENKYRFFSYGDAMLILRKNRKC